VSAGDRAEGRIAGADFGPRWIDFTVDWTGIELPTVSYGEPPPVDDLPLFVVDRRVVRLSRVVVRATDEEPYLVATGWRPDRGWSIAMRGIHGSGRHPSGGLRGPTKVLSGLRLIALVGRGGRPGGIRVISDEDIAHAKALLKERAVNPIPHPTQEDVAEELIVSVETIQRQVGKRWRSF
jgi:hypothetical protein